MCRIISNQAHITYILRLKLALERFWGKISVGALCPWIDLFYNIGILMSNDSEKRKKKRENLYDISTRTYSRNSRRQEVNEPFLAEIKRSFFPND